MSKTDDGGPIAASMTKKTRVGENTYRLEITEAEGGLSIRDYFAAAALQGWLASYPERDTPHPAMNECENDVARLSYKMADAMLAARKEAQP